VHRYRKSYKFGHPWNVGGDDMNVKIYSTPECPWCKKAKAFLKENKVEFTDIDVAADEIKAKEMMEKSGQMGTPVIDVEGKLIIGYDEAKLKEALGL
jgi:glutaredoxin 3